MELSFSDMCYYGFILIVILAIAFFIHKRYNTKSTVVSSDDMNIREELDAVKDAVIEVRNNFNTLVSRLEGEEDSQEPQEEMNSRPQKQGRSTQQQITNKQVPGQQVASTNGMSGVIESCPGNGVCSANGTTAEGLADF